MVGSRLLSEVILNQTLFALQKQVKHVSVALLQTMIFGVSSCIPMSKISIYLLSISIQ